MEQAQRLMGYGDRKLTDIAGLLGFSSLSAFSRWQQKHMLKNADQ